MVKIDAALERRVWERVYGGEKRGGTDIRLRQLRATAADCAALCSALRKESSPNSAGVFAKLEKEMLRAVKALSEAMGEWEVPRGTQNCPGCSRERKLWLLKLWLREWARGCREHAPHSSHRRLLENLADMGLRYSRLLEGRGR